MSRSHFIDVSNYQDTSKLNWANIAKTQAFVIMKATEGVKFVDKSLDAKVAKCREHKIPFGLYHFARPDQNNGGYRKDAEAEANDFCKQLLKYSDFSIRPVLDLEYRKTPLTKEELHEWCNIFARVVKEQTGRDIILYTGYYYVQDMLPANHTLNRFPLWLAQYNGKDEPNRIPKGWDTYTMWQYTDKFQDPSIYLGPLDGNWIRDKDIMCL